MAERLVPADEKFAEVLDGNCEHCRADGGNARQLLTLRGRKARKITSQEGKVLQALISYCGLCFAAGRLGERTISAKYSRAWRSGPWEEVEWED